jgi:hypothetical protein
MSQPTTTRANLRKTICLELGMPFHKRYGTSSTLTGGTSDAPIDTKLTQANDFWNSGWMYPSSGSSTGEIRLITDFISGSSIQLERALSYAPTSGNTYEILSIFSPYEIHEAINRAIQTGFPSFFDTINDETLIVCDDKIAYDISTLTVRPWTVLNVWVERNTTRSVGTATATSATSLTDSTADFSDVSTDWKISIYDGKGAGQIRSVSSVTGTTQINVATWTTTPDTTSKYAIWNPTEQEQDWCKLARVRFDQKEYPTTMYMPTVHTSVLGLRFRLQYTCIPADLSTDAGTTVVPSEYIINQALGFLCGSRVNNNRADRQRYQVLEQRYFEKAEIYKKQHAFRHPDISLWMEAESNNMVAQTPDDPLDWNRGY